MVGGPIDLSGLTKPATVLIERISDAVGGIARPWQIERVAKAEAAGAITRAKAQIEISELERRAIERLVIEEGKKQDNIEAISYGATAFLEDNSKPELISEDWLSHFFDRSRLTSDKEMQNLWSRILAGEANSCGSFSRKTVDLISTLEKKDAELVLKLANSSIFLKDYDENDKESDDYDLPYAIIEWHNPQEKKGLWHFRELIHLEDLGFIKFDTNGFCISDVPNNISFKYANTNNFINIGSQSNRVISIGDALLTKAGQEVMHIVDQDYDEKSLNEMISYWFDRGYSVGCHCK